MDTLLFRNIVSLSGRYPALDYLFIFFSDYLIFILMVGLVVGYAVYRDRAWSIILYSSLISSVIAHLIVKSVILIFYEKARPYVSLGDIVPLTTTPIGADFASFPSTHALIAFAIAGSVALVNRKWGRYFIIGAILVGIGRIYVGLHYPSDVLAGAILGLLVAYLVSRLYKHLLYK